MRINRFLARSGIASRRKSEILLGNGRVSINGVVKKEPYIIVDTDNDIVEVDGEVVRISEKIYIMMNKPVDVVTTTSDRWGRKTVIDVIEKELPDVSRDILKGLFPVGRLDRDTTGLLLFTNDGKFCNDVIHPSKKIEKVYRVLLNRRLIDVDMKKIIEGKVLIEDRAVVPNELKFIKKVQRGFIYQVVLEEGRKRIIRRMFKGINASVIKMERTAIGGLTIGRLPVGKCKILTKDDVERVFL